MNSDILWPCKFCGGEAAPIRFERIDGRQEYSVMCRRCGIGLFLPDLEHATETSLFPTLTAAIEAWNRRPTDPPQTPEDRRRPWQTREG